VRLPRGSERFLKLLFDSHIEGEATSSPLAGSFTFTLLGDTLTLRVVRGVTYLYEPAISRRDGGRPWVKVGRSGLGAMFDQGGSVSPSSGHGLSSFKGVAGAVRAAVAVRELGAGVVDGQAIAGYRMVVPASALSSEKRPTAPQPRGILAGVFGPNAIPPPTEPVVNAVLEVFVAAAGVPVRARVSVASEGLTLGLLSDVFAINFPLEIRAPAQRLTITSARLELLERRRKSR
jgi:hypothetical protein